MSVSVHCLHTVAGTYSQRSSDIEVDAFLEMIRFFETLILNADEATEF